MAECVLKQFVDLLEFGERHLRAHACAKKHSSETDLRRPNGGIWISRSLPDPSRDTPFRDFETQLEQFAVNAQCSPGGILGNHTEDQGANLFADMLPSSDSSES
jgi:hypothetical protein